MKKFVNSLTFIVTLFVITIMGTATFLDTRQSGVNFIIVLLYLFFLLIMPRSVNFVVLLIISLAYGFILTFYSYETGFSVEKQGTYILMHLLLTTSLVLLWLAFYKVREIMSEKASLQLEVEKLQKYSDVPNLLSTNEFINQAKVLLTGMKRRGEDSFLLKITLPHHNLTSKSAISSFTTICLDTLRINYDLITKYNDETVVIFLQNTTKDGAEIVADRIIQNLKQEFKQNPFHIEMTQIDTLDHAFENFNIKVNVI